MAGEAYIPRYPQGGTVTPIGSHTEGHRANAKRFTNILSEGYLWIRKRLPGPGAQNYAFETMALSETTAIGPGVAQRQFWASIAPPLFIETLSRPQSGYGGVTQGQTLSQPLFDPYNNQYGNIMGPANG